MFKKEFVRNLKVGIWWEIIKKDELVVGIKINCTRGGGVLVFGIGISEC